MECFRCEGSGKVQAFINRGEDITLHSVDWIKCGTCNGSGSIDDEKARRIVKGRELRQHRILRNETLAEAARKMGIDPAQLSAIEQGHGPDEAYTK